MPQDETQNNIQVNHQEEIASTPKAEVYVTDKAASTDKSNSDVVTDKFDKAFAEASPVIQDYILSSKFEEHIKLICKIAKLEGEKENVIIENVSVSILVGLLPLEEAKKTLVESFKSSEVSIDKDSAENILKNIDTYILSDIRKQVLESKNGSRREIKHLTLKESNYEKEKEELRKILLERTGALTGKGATLIQYKDRAIESLQKEAEANGTGLPVKSLKDSVVNRDSLLSKMNIKDLADTEKIKERMMQIKAEEDLRIAKLQEEEKAKEELRLKREELQKKRKEEVEEFNKENETVLVEEKVKEEESVNISKLLAKQLSEKLENNADEEVDLDVLREKRAREEADIQKNNVSSYAKEMSSAMSGSVIERGFDAYRESF